MSGPRAGTVRILWWAGLWATAFGVVEGAVVVYLRALAYPDGFAFPLRPLGAGVLATEMVREAATLVMLLGVACLAARGGLRRFAVFAWCFGVWDLVYYLTLAVALVWPAGLLDWDVLFLLPLPWVAPVLAPVLVSLSLMWAGASILRATASGRAPVLRPVDWAVEVLAGATIIASFLVNTPALRDGRAPEHYPWWLFACGWLGGCGWFARVWFARGRREPPTAARSESRTP
jgi:hypothetical protein